MLTANGRTRVLFPVRAFHRRNTDTPPTGDTSSAITRVPTMKTDKDRPTFPSEGLVLNHRTRYESLCCPHTHHLEYPSEHGLCCVCPSAEPDVFSRKFPSQWHRHLIGLRQEQRSSEWWAGPGGQLISSESGSVLLHALLSSSLLALIFHFQILCRWFMPR